MSNSQNLIDSARIVKENRANNIRSAMAAFGYLLMQGVQITSVTGDYDTGYKINEKSPEDLEK